MSIWTNFNFHFWLIFFFQIDFSSKNYLAPLTTVSFHFFSVKNLMIRLIRQWYIKKGDMKLIPVWKHKHVQASKVWQFFCGFLVIVCTCINRSVLWKLFFFARDEVLWNLLLTLFPKWLIWLIFTCSLYNLQNFFLKANIFTFKELQLLYCY